MTRALLEAALLFALPFGAYVGWLAARRRYPFLSAHWTSGRLLALVATGLAAVALGLVVLGLAVPRHAGAYVPARVENGRLVPGFLR